MEAFWKKATETLCSDFQVQLSIKKQICLLAGAQFGQLPARLQTSAPNCSRVTSWVACSAIGPNQLDQVLLLV